MPNGFEQLNSIPRDITGLLAQAGEPFAVQRLSREQARNLGSAVPTGSPYANFGLALMDLLRQYQQVGTRPLVEQQFAAQQAQVNRALAPTSPELIGAAPQIQAAVREAQVGALEPVIAGARQAQRTFAEQIQGFGDALTQARAIGQWIQDVEENRTKNALDLIFKLPSAVKRLPEKEKRRLETIAGLQKGLVDLIPETIEQKTQVVELSSGQKVLINSQTGNIIKELEPAGQVQTTIAKLPTQAQEQIVKLQTIDDNTKRLESLVNEIGTKGFGPESRATGFIRKQLSKIGLDPIVRQFLDTRQSMIAPLARIISGEVGVLTDFDIKRAEGLLPRLGESKEEVRRKLKSLKETITERKGSIQNLYGFSLPSRNLAEQRIPQQPLVYTLPNGRKIQFKDQASYNKFIQALNVQPQRGLAEE